MENHHKEQQISQQKESEVMKHINMCDALQDNDDDDDDDEVDQIANTGKETKTINIMIPPITHYDTATTTDKNMCNNNAVKKKRIIIRRKRIMIKITIKLKKKLKTQITMQI